MVFGVLSGIQSKKWYLEFEVVFGESSGIWSKGGIRSQIIYYLETKVVIGDKTTIIWSLS